MKNLAKLSFSKGFTLIEILVVMGVVVVFSFIVYSVIVIVLRGSDKSDTILVVKQNGDFAMDQIIKTLRFARSLDSPSMIGGASPSCSNTGTTVQSVVISKVDLSTVTISCPASSNAPNSISLNGRMLTNSNSVAVTSCSFVCYQSQGGRPNIRVFFDLSKINASGFPEDVIDMPFQSSVILRNSGI